MRLESVEERSFYIWAQKQGYECLKLQQTKGWPDRLLLCPGELAVFFEFKRLDEKPTKYQQHIHKIIRKLGFLMFVVFSCEEAQEILKHIIKKRRKNAL